MRALRLWLTALALLLALAGMLTQAGRLARSATANGERIAALHALTRSVQSGSIDELAWDAGWRSLCDPETQPVAPGSSQEAAGFIARGLLDRGDYAGALAGFRQAATAADGAEAELARAYVAALELRWLDAARLYPGQPNARHQRFWGTVFYLAAQELMFQGRTEEAAPWYRRADQSYDAQGPYLGLSLVECLAQQGRTLEAFDAYRRGLVVLPAGEALAQRERFEQMRLDALRMWRAQDPANAQVAAWLDFFEDHRPAEAEETLASPPQPMAVLNEDLGDGRRLVGLDYRREEIETGPFLWVDLTIQEGEGEDDPIVRLRRAVLNQAPNGSFTWDAAPDGVRPFGWHEFLYSHEARALQYREMTNSRRWLCLNGGEITSAIGLASGNIAINNNGSRKYLQGARALMTEGGEITYTIRWSGTAEPYPFFFLDGGRVRDQFVALGGVWTPQIGIENATLWLVSQPVGRACAHDLYLFSWPDFSVTS